MPALLYGLNIILVAMTGGAFLLQALVVGAFFNWLLHHGRADAIVASWAPFRADRPLLRHLFPIMLAVDVLMASLSLIANLTTHPTGPQLLAIVLPAAAYFGLHHGTGFARVEELVCTGGGLTPVALAKYLGFNRPLYVVYAAVCALASLILLLT